MIRIRYIMEYLRIRPFYGHFGTKIQGRSTRRLGHRPAPSSRKSESVLMQRRAARCVPSPRSGAVRQLDRQAVVGRLDMRRQPPAQLVVVEVRMQIGQDRPPGLERLDQLQR